MNNATMTRKIRGTAVLLLLVMLTALLTLPIAAASYPKATDNIADTAKILTESTVRQLKKTNATLLSKTGTQVAVCAVKTTGDTPISEYARALFTEWKLGEGVLLLVAVDDGNYYILQSTGVEDKVTNSVLTSIRDEYMEESFADGDMDRAVFRTASKIANFLQSEVNLLEKEEDVPAETPAQSGTTETDGKTNEKKGTTAGSVIVGFLKTILILVLIALAAFVLLFVAALFNDDAAAILQKTVFRKKTTPPVQTYYDERLYGSPRQRPRNGNAPQRRPADGSRQPRPNPNSNSANRPNPNRAPRPNGQHPGQASRNGAAYYNADGTPRRTGNPAPQRPRPNAMENAEETRAFQIPQNRR